MQIYPAIDLRGGKVVRLLQGDYARETQYSADPIELAQHYQAQGADWLHVVDLDAARGDSSTNLLLVERIARETTLKVQLGGGVRNEADVSQRLALGCKRVVIGSMAVREPNTVIAWQQRFGAEALCLALDCRADPHGVYRVHVAGWQQAAELELYDSLQLFGTAGFKHALITDIALDGMLSGPNLALYAAVLASKGGIAIQASGGIAQLSDLRSLRALKIDGVIIGKALLQGNFSVAEALAC